MNVKRLITKRTMVAGLAALVVAVGAGGALATTTDVFNPKAEHDAFEATVAKELGVTANQLEDAFKTASLKRLDAAVAAGRITKEQAAEMRAHIQSGEFPGRGMGGPGMGGPGMPGHGGHLTAAADYLELTEAALATKLQAGQSLADVAKVQGKSADGLKQALIADAKKNLDQAVKDGKLTAAQRDAMLADMQSRVDDMINRTGPPEHGPMGGLGGHGPMDGFGGPPDA